MNEPDSGTRQEFERLMGDLRPKLHRYCARMAGSVIDGEDVVQDALVKAIEAFGTAPVANPDGWLFRIAHNTAMDFLRRRARRQVVDPGDEDMTMVVDPIDAVGDRQIVTASLHTFMRLPVMQRSSVILMDVLGYSLQEIGAIAQISIPTVKAALHRGRMRLRELADEPDDSPAPILTGQQRALLGTYVGRFNARDFDAIRDMLAEEVRLELVGRTQMNGRREVGGYLHNYALTDDWLLSAGLVERYPAVLVRDPQDPSGKPVYFVLLEWQGDQVLSIRDFRYARYVTESADLADI